MQKSESIILRAPECLTMISLLLVAGLRTRLFVAPGASMGPAGAGGSPVRHTGAVRSGTPHSLSMRVTRAEYHYLQDRARREGWSVADVLRFLALAGMPRCIAAPRVSTGQRDSSDSNCPAGRLTGVGLC
jgi:hypothetical protein